ncbi:MAG: hypothetical protein D6706_08030 [Chloroflexi bacterium]|nr:MAG: hypothetical protein D6706_08030 [Chloroflexota bacterium]
MKISNGNINSRMLSVYAWLTTLFKKEDIQLTMIRAYYALASGTNSYKIGLSAGNNELTADKTQVLIGKNDGFAPVAGRMVVRKAVGSNYAVAEEATFEDKTIFNAPNGGSGFTENENIRGLYFGSKVNLDVEGDAILDGLPAELFRFVPPTQAGSAAVAQMGDPLSYSSFTNLYKDVILAGGTDVAIKIQLSGFTPDAKIVGDSSVSGEQNYVGFHLIGFQIKGGDNKTMELSDNQNCAVR